MIPTDSSAASDTPPARRSSRGWIGALVVVLGVALAWRLAIAANMPAIARDGVQFCWQARDLGIEGVSLLRSDRYPQHPAFAALTLATQRGLRGLGWADESLTWQTAGQAVALASGLAVVLLTAALTLVLARQLAGGNDGGAPGDAATARQAAHAAPSAGHDTAWAPDEQAPRAALLAAAIAALLPLNVWLSVDVMSDELHAALYVGGALAMLHAASVRGAALAGLCGGLAFLTRPEGATVWLATVLLIASRIGRQRQAMRAPAGLATSPGPRTPARAFDALTVRAALVRIAAATVAFVVCAAPYWMLTGSLSAKLDKEAVEEFLPTALPSPAALLRESVPPHELLPRALYETGRAGRVVVPLLAILALAGLRRRLAHPPLLGPLLCMGVHFGLSAWNLHHAGYLDPRHTLVVVALLTPLAAIALAQTQAIALRRRRRWVGVVVIAACLAPLAAYAARIPNADAAVLREVARVIRGTDPDAESRLLLGGSSEKRIAFYADLQFQAWPENEPEPGARYAALRDHVLYFRPQYVAISFGAGREVADNERLANALAGDDELRAAATLAVGTVSGHAVSVRLITLRWPSAAPTSHRASPP
ncbi:MAG: hypothetical protein AB7Q17_10515 [Phycisphaerae bacterium]